MSVNWFTVNFGKVLVWLTCAAVVPFPAEWLAHADALVARGYENWWMATLTVALWPRLWGLRRA